MDVDKLFKNVRNLNDYMSVTEGINRKFINQKVLFNMSTVLSLKKVRSLEIEYFNNSHENGAAIMIIERLLQLPPSKTWEVLGKELISLVQYWLDATRKNLITHSPFWWQFLNFLLKFIKEIKSKDPILPDIVVEGTTERLLDLATKRQPDIFQRQAILQCLNTCCAVSSRKTRFALRHQLEHYFVKLSTILAISGDLPTQHVILETLIRWLLPRHNLAVRQAAAAKWFPNILYRRNTVEIFLQREWKNFYEDARQFLNAHNKENRTILSVNCRRITIGATVVLSDLQDRNVWLDVNSSSKSISILMHPQMLQTLGANDMTSFTYLVIAQDNVQTAQLCRQSNVVKIVVKTLNDMMLYPASNSVGANEVCVEVSSRIDMRSLDQALRNILDDKYQGLLDFENLSALSPCNASTIVCETTDEDTRLSQPVQVTRRKRSGYMVRSKATYFKSPSSTSTTSLALLHDRVAAHPINFDKVPVKVSVLPKLSNVSEVTEVDDRHTFTSCSTKTLRPYGVCCKGIVTDKKKQQTNSEHRNYTSPVVNVHPTSCLLVATIGSDESIINDTLERLSKSKEYTNDNVVDLLVQEAFRSEENTLSENNINACDNKITQGIHVLSARKNIVQNVTSDDSNEIKETPYEFVNVRRRNLFSKRKEKEESDKAFRVNELVHEDYALEQFFSQEIDEDKQNCVNVSPTIAKKYNETSSESDELDKCLNEDWLKVYNFQNSDIIDCLNNIIDKVCNDFDKCAEIINRDNTEIHSMASVNIDAGHVENGLVVNTESIDTSEELKQIPPKKKATKQKGNIKLKFNTNNDRINKTRSRKLKSKFDLVSANPLSPIREIKDSVEPDTNPTPVIEPVYVQLKNKSVSRPKCCIVVKKALKEITLPKSKVNSQEINSVSLDTPLVDRKRKVCSSKNKLLENQKENIRVFELEHNNHIEPNTIQMSKEIVSPKNIINNPKINTVSPGSDNSDTPLLIRRKRKLYSPKEDIVEENENINISDNENGNDTKYKTDIIIRSPEFAATSYKEIEKERKKNIRQHRIKRTRSKGKCRTPSPRAKKLNDVFDALKEDVQRNQNIFFGDKKSIEHDMAIYNFTSDSEDDEDFKIKKIEVKKRISRRLTNSDLTTSPPQVRDINRLNHKEKISDKAIKKPVKQRKTCTSRKKPTRHKPYNLLDERLREVPPEELNTSMIIEKLNTVEKEPDPDIVAVPQMEIITDEEYDKIEKTNSEQKTRNKKLKADVPTLPKKINQQNKKNIPNDNDDRTISPLPELVVENVVVIQDDLNDSLSSQIIMKKLKETYKVDLDDDPNKTQNLLNVDSAELSNKLDITDNSSKCYPGEVNKNVITGKSKPKIRRNIKNIKGVDSDIIENYTVTDIACAHEASKMRKENKNIKNISNNSGGKSEISINTLGKSPITAHGDMNEAPPDFQLLNETVTPRNLELKSLDSSLKEYFLKLRDDITDLPIHSKQLSINNNQPLVVSGKTDINKTEDAIFMKSPTVPITKLSNEDIRQWLPSARNSESESSSSKNDFKPKTITTSRSHQRSNVNDRESKANKKGNDIVNMKSNARSQSNSNESTRTGKKKIYNQRELKNNTTKGRNKAKTTLEDSNVSKTTLNKHSSNDVSDKESKLVFRISHTHKLVKNRHTNSLPCDSDDSISSIRLDDLKSTNTPHNKEKHTIISNTSNDPNVKKNNIISSDDSDNSEISSIRPDDKDTSNKPYNENTEVDAKISETCNDPGDKENNGSKEVIKRNNRKRSLSISSNRSKLSMRKDNVKAFTRSVSKPRSEDPPSEDRKKKKSECLLSESGPSVSSVNDWFRRNTPLSLADSTRQSYTDVMRGVIEKLDTTVEEIHQNTSKKFIHLFVNVQSQLAEHRTQKLNMFKQATDDILSQIAGIMEVKNADLAQRSQQMDIEFTEQLKHLSSQLIKEDLIQKRTIVVLLKEDMQAVMDHLAEKRPPSTKRT